MLVYHRVSNYACASLARAAARCLTSSAAPGDSSSSSSSSISSQLDSIFATKESPWDRVLGDSINDLPSTTLPSPVRNPLRAPSTETSAHSRARRQAMTAREVSAFDEMFNMIFDAVSEQKNPSARLSSKKDDPLAMLNGIGRRPLGQAPMSDLFGKLRRHSKRLKWTTEADQEFDKKKEEMELCDTDQQLLEWAMREVFGQSQQYEERARNAIAKAEEQHAPAPAASDANANANASANLQPQLPQFDLQHPTYPYLIAHLIRSFRDKYRDPHLALSIFDYARHLSIPSYVFGCTTPAYNELIETRWSCFRDLKGVHDALEEMRVNGVEPDSRTKKLVETLRREVGARTIWEEESVFGSGEVVGMLAKIEQLAIKEPRRKQAKGKAWGKKRGPAFDAWKGDALKEDPEDGYEFGQWGGSREFGQYGGSRKPKPTPRRREQDSERTRLDDDWLDGKMPGDDRLEFK